jgi:hypothetical protein
MGRHRRDDHLRRVGSWIVCTRAGSVPSGEEQPLAETLEEHTGATARSLLHTPELRFVRDLVAQGLGDPLQTPEPARTLDWARVVFLLTYHGLTSWVTRANPERLAEMPDSYRRRVQQQRLVNTMRVDRHLVFLDDLQSRLADRDIPLLVLKGIGLSLRHYRDPAVRACGDLDVLVPKQHLRSVHTLMPSLGYALSAQCPAGVDAFEWALLHEKGLVYRSTGAESLPAEYRPLEVEVHHRPAPYPANFAPPAGIHAAAAEVETRACRMRILPAPYQLANLLQHGAISRWARFKWVIDVEQELRLTGSEDVSVPSQTESDDVRRAWTSFLAVRGALLLGPSPKGARPHRLIADELNNPGTSLARTRGLAFLARVLSYELSLAGGWRHRGQILLRRLQRLAEVSPGTLPAATRCGLWLLQPLVRAYIRSVLPRLGTPAVGESAGP